jgi:hypothetical protein
MFISWVGESNVENWFFDSIMDEIFDDQFARVVSLAEKESIERHGLGLCENFLALRR